MGAAKLLAGGVSAVRVAMILFFSVLGVCMFCYGINPNAQVQLYNNSSMPITAGQELLLTFLALALYSLLCGGLVMLASLVALDAVAGLTAALAPVILDLFFSSKLDYTPLHLFQGRLFEIYHLAKIGGFLFNYLQAALLVFSIGAVLFLVVCGLCWRWWAVSGR